MKKILLSVSQQKIADLFKTQKFTDEYECIGNCPEKNDLMALLNKDIPDIFLITEMVVGDKINDTINFLLKLHSEVPKMRIILVTSKNNSHEMWRLIEVGIYDIYCDTKMSGAILKNLLDNEKKYNDVSELIENRSELKEEIEEEAVIGTGLKNISIFSSIKPGSGKSLIATNVAAAIAKYGRPNAYGRRPKVAILEGDLQTLSVGTLLQLNDINKNLRNALKQVETVISDEGVITGGEQEIRSVKRYVKDCFLQYYDIDNLFALVGSQMTLNDLNEINPFQYYFMVEMIAEEFDVIIVDSNSSLEHKTTGPLLDLASKCFYVLDLDFNNVSNNIRYRNELKAIGVMNKVHYILNKDIPKEMAANFSEPLEFDSKNIANAGIEVCAKVPIIDTTIVYNRAKRGRPLVLDRIESTLPARKEIFKIADMIWPCDILSDIKDEMESYKRPVKTSRKWFLFRK
ncbi:hypothetical protein MKA27_13270 [[Clostridium] innocuum]|uniref:AAA family ATPase n=1 Tax=Clostridium innocuum TaxID=1522 RepID=UPI000D6B0570|nr:hypothetical protein [[Clostridium] innocuum]MCR0315280.1 hypothetical protein [[Clostridium] innocuum]MCR0369698.1 hypothetical protein [[Clostridium] innocuum]MCR0374790.1 hypothetical protein [[Clostridium] innocuum]MCR0559651.1 hypothetical protein [[Clostridium] innocuum]MCR0602655.1 hypothetical protein [[Clostridium] innocuum]